MTWVVIAIVLALALNVPRLFVFRVLFPAALRVRRLRRLHYFLWTHSLVYRRWSREQFRLSFVRLARTIGEALLPAVKKATAAFDDWNRSWAGSPVDDVRTGFRDLA